MPDELLVRAGLHDGDELYLGVDRDGALIVERTRLFESGEAFLEHLREEHERLLADGR